MAEHNQELDLELLRTRLQRIPLFPLSDAVLLPGGYLPLHVSEPHQLQLVKDCLAGDRLLVAGLQTPPSSTASGPPSIFPTAALGLIQAYAALSDGRYFALLMGVARTRILKELAGDEPYRLVRVAPILDRSKPASREHLPTSALVLRSLVMELVKLLPTDLGEPLAKASQREQDPGRLADLVAAVMLVDYHHRQQFLEETDIAARLDQMTVIVATVLRRLTGGAHPRPLN